jgi:hypothetical protein
MSSSPDQEFTAKISSSAAVYLHWSGADYEVDDWVKIESKNRWCSGCASYENAECPGGCELDTIFRKFPKNISEEI